MVFVEGLPVLRRRPAGAAEVQVWTEQPAPLELEPPAAPARTAGSCSSPSMRRDSCWWKGAISSAAGFCHPGSWAACTEVPAATLPPPP